MGGRLHIRFFSRFVSFLSGGPWDSLLKETCAGLLSPPSSSKEQSLGGLPSAKSPCFLCPWSGQRTQVCTTLIQMSGELWAMAPSSVSPPSPSLIQPASPLLSSDQADALCPPHIRSGCALCWDCCSPHVTPLLTAFSLCSVRPPRPLTCFCDLTSQHLQPLGFFFFSCC